MVNGLWSEGKGGEDKLESVQGILAHRLCNYAPPAVQLKAGPHSFLGDKAIVESVRLDSSGVIAKGKPPPILHAGTLALTHCLVMVCSRDCVHKSLGSKVPFYSPST